ncbi:type 1 glutamine amidotransferase domain-containing protein [Actinomadura madurae]|uniref:type 1 glutamine amidotransferase domain-containing protein n=1 Tax=Actinomadura madurae TaxID=1993 RepID=UPI0020D24676|nr:type 1 glutamine amidotransferase domain-containing protein [Actinomadura madurae]MCQ0020467.1 type 1 glutamine amidotransferase [Actinomadura madurae]
MASNDLQGRTVAFLCAPEGTEQVELTEPWKAVEQAGGRPRLVSTQSGRLQAFDHLDKADTFPIDTTVDVSDHTEFDALLLPGGVANPDFLRTDPGGRRLRQVLLRRRKPVAVICHGPWTLIEAGVVRGRTLASWPSLQTDLRNAGATWVDEEVKVCEAGPNVLVSSRKPDDLKAFCRAAVEAFAR